MGPETGGDVGAFVGALEGLDVGELVGYRKKEGRVGVRYMKDFSQT